MKCYRCGTIVDIENVCPHCGSNIKAYRDILITSEILYNQGLKQAQVRDLSGAIDSLRQALQYNKYNTKARNLLGLCYFEIGEIVMALSEWVISKNLDSDNAPADKYLGEIQNTPGLLDSLNQTTKKYNQALQYCTQGSHDLAIIQLRKVLNMNSNFVAGHQLLALLYMQEKKYNDARKELSVAGKIDVGNVITLRYTKEVREKLKEQSQKKPKKKKDMVEFQDGNDTIMMPTNSFRDMLDSSRASIVNIVTGLAIGLLICFFLVVPTVKQNASERAAESLIDANEELNNSSSNVSQLKKKVETLEKELDKYTGKSDAVNSYEQLMAAKEAYDAGDLAKAQGEIDQINRDLLSTKGQAEYDRIHDAVYTVVLGNLMREADQLFNRGEYEQAIEKYTQIIAINEDYQEGNALFHLAESQWKLSQRDAAIKSYKRVLELHPSGRLSAQARNRLAETGSTDDLGGDEADENQTTDNDVAGGDIE